MDEEQNIATFKIHVEFDATVSCWDDIEEILAKLKGQTVKLQMHEIDWYKQPICKQGAD